MTQNIFGAETPVTQNVEDGVALSVGTRFQSDVNGTVTHARWWFPTVLPGGTVQAGLFRNSDSSLLANVSFTSPVAGDWNQVAFSSPVTIVAGVEYTIVIWTPSRYVATGGYFVSPKVVGNLTCPLAAGRFTTGGTGPQFPSGGFNNGCYFADVVFVPAGAPAGLTVTVWNGSVELPTSGITVWNGSVELPATVESVV